MISVIMGIYNSPNKEQVELSINSILNQTYTNFEFIICDDGSTDDTYMFLQEFASKDKRIVLLHNDKNNGLAFTLNTCLKKAKGKYIARMDADDIALPDRFAIEYDFLELNPQYAMVGCNINYIDDGGIWGYRMLPEKVKKEDFLFSSPFVHPSIMIRTEVLKRLDGYRVESVTLRQEDYDLWMRLYAAGYEGYNIQQVLLNFREDKYSYGRRKYRYRLDEAYVRYRGFRSLGLLYKGFLYVLKPVLVGLIPNVVLKKIRFLYAKNHIF